ncbi:MAG: trypsin-like peptidase domain-containing protein [Limnochordales bacterium]|nr:trypsin-like peptidase domain-containing protein [Limnochordales bacterium]
MALTLFATLPDATWKSLGLSARVLPPLRPTASRDDSLEERIKNVAREVGPAVVKITTTTETMVENLFFRIPQETEGVGSGVIIDSRGLVLTNNHVVAGAKRIDVFLSDGRHFPGRVRGADPWSDLAVIQLEGLSAPEAAGRTTREKLPVAKLADSDKLEVGQFVIAIGNPFRFDHSVTVGVISALQRTLPVVPEGVEVPGTNTNGRVMDESQAESEVGAVPVYLEGLIQTDASINPGNSGGPLLDTSGRVVGINTAILQPIQGITPNIGFAIPINRAMEVARQLLEHGRVLRLGVVGGSLTPEIAAALAQITGQKLPVEKGAYIVQIIPRSPAEKIGLQPNDVIVLANGKRIETMEELVAVVRKAGFGGSLELGFYRRGERRSARVRL